MILLIDNYDSFTYNLVQYFQCLGQTVSVYKNDEITIAELEAIDPDHIVLSPGPNSPQEAGISLKVIDYFHTLKPILGVCLGHQCLAQAFGGHIIQAPEIVHGKTSAIFHSGRELFHTLPQGFQATRYHSLTVEETTLPQCLQIDAWTSDNTIMGLSHQHYPLFGVQFHPEAILSEHGILLLENFIKSSRSSFAFA